jgi:hypothetical protein
MRELRRQRLVWLFHPVERCACCMILLLLMVQRKRLLDVLL